MDEEEAIKKINAVINEDRWDKETLHSRLDYILLQCVPASVRKRYEEIEKEVDGFWYA